MGELPPVRDEYLPKCLLSAGPVEQTGFGAVGISPQRLESWCRLTGWPVNPWQAEVVLEMSSAYAAQVSDDKAPAPWQREIEDKAALGDAIERVFDMAAAVKNR